MSINVEFPFATAAAIAARLALNCDIKEAHMLELRLYDHITIPSAQ
jgi:hypothetical protein